MKPAIVFKQSLLAPSRELATQIYQAARQIATHSEVEVRVVNYVGGDR